MNNKLENNNINTTQGADFYYELGNDYFAQGQYNLALQSYNKAIDLNTDNYKVYHNAGIICVELDQYDLAIDCFKKAVNLNPNDDNAFYFLGFSYEIENEYSMAIENYKRAITINPNNRSASVAIDNLNQVLDQNVDDSNTYYNMAMVYNTKGEYDVAIDNLNKAITLNPDNADAYFSLATLFYDKGELYLAFENFNKAIQINKEFANNTIYKTLKDQLSDEKHTVKLLSGLCDRLNNLNPRNRSLRLLRISKEWNFDLTNLDEIESYSSNRVLGCLLKDVTPIPLMEINLNTGLYEDIEGEEKQIKLQKKYFNHLNSLNRKANSIESETGIYDLYIGYPFVECKCLDGTYLRAPLLLNPCRLEKVKEPHYGWILKTDQEFRPIFNETLFMGLQKFNNTVIPPEFFVLEPDIEEDELLDWALNYFKENNVPIVLEKELNTYTEKLKEYIVADIPDMPTGKIFVKPYSILGIFPQSTSNLKPDYENMINNPDTLDNVLELLGKKEVSEHNGNLISYSEIDKRSEIDKFSITDTDESQDRVIEAFRKDQNFVIHGPPGTGKSHVILNIIAESLARNKKVLIVCQKRAALDVIYNRLQAEGLSQYLALVHDHEKDKKFIFNKIKEIAIKSRELHDSNILDDKTFENLSEKINTTINKINLLTKQQKELTEKGLSPYDIYCQLSKIDKNFEINISDYFISNIIELKDTIKPLLFLASYYEKYENNHYLLKNRTNWANKDENFKETLIKDFNEIINTNNLIKQYVDVLVKFKLPEKKDNNNVYSLFYVLNKLIKDTINNKNTSITIKENLEELEKVKNNYYTIYELLKNQAEYGLTIYELFAKSININNEEVISLTGYEKTLKYSELDDFIRDICSLIEYYKKLENDSFSLKREQRTNWGQLKVDAINKADITIKSIINSSNNLQGIIKELDLNKITLNEYREHKHLLFDVLELLKAIKQDNQILKILIDWEKASFPEYNFTEVYHEAAKYLDNLNHERWNIFADMNFDTAEILKENITRYLKYKSPVKFIIPAWWKAKKNINNILENYHLDINVENIDKIILKTNLTLDFTRLQKIIKYDLAFISNHDTYKETEIIAILKNVHPYFISFKEFLSSLISYNFQNSYELENKITLENIIKELTIAQNYIHLHDELINNIESLNNLLNTDYINLVLNELNDGKDISNIFISISQDIKQFEDIITFDSIYYSLSDSQQYFIRSLINKFSINSEDILSLWKRVTENSFILHWLKQEKNKYTILNTIDNEELLKIAEKEIKKSIDEIIINLSELLNNKEKIISNIDKLSYALDKELINNLKNNLNETDKCNNNFKNLLNCIEDFNELVEMDDLRISLTDTQKYFLEQLASKWQPSEENLTEKWEQALIRSYYIEWINEIEKNNPLLKTLSTKTFSNQIDTLNKDYLKKLTINKKYINKKLKHQLSQLPSTDMLRGKKKLKDLEYQVNKKRKLWSLRKIMQEYGDTHVLKMLPCWLMSPESVSTVMPYEKELFDIVIFDEASQCSQEYALPSLVRAKQIIVAGDEKQLPPLNIFHTSLDDSINNEMFSDAQSLLSLSKGIYPTYLLSWHYRSRFEELINFSNHAFYGGKIQIAPNIITHTNNPAIEWHNVNDGLWIKNTNKKEAIEVVEYLNKLITSTDKPPTIGIITFNTTQQNLILDLIDKKETEDSIFAEAYAKIKQLDLDETLFVKNIENVQGDERDLIIFSIGYARDYQNKISTNFGLLNRIGGENRLNVAVTRSKQKIVVFCSVKPDDFNVDSSKNIGPKLFRKYLEYALHTSNNNLESTKSILTEINPFQKEIMAINKSNYNDTFINEVNNELINLGYKVKNQVGCSEYKVDIAILDPDDDSKYILGLECEGPNYFSSNSARSRVITRNNFLKSKGWNIERIWCRNWYNNKDKELKRIISLINDSNIE